MRFSPRWVAAVPGLDLNATFLCGDRLVIGGRTETACIDRQSGEVLWQKALRSAACVVTPSGLVRVEPDGRLSCHDLSDGELRFGLQLTPRRAGGAAGSVLNGAGLPKLLALCEGDRQITGIDLLGGAVRWRYTARRPAPFRLRRAGRLLIAAGGDPLLVALDGVTGEVVWTLRGRLPFQPDLALDHDVGFALSGSPGGTTRLHRFNPWSGEEAWSVELDERPLGGHRPLLTADCVVVPTFDQEGAGAIAYDRETGEKLWEQAPGLVSVTSAWLAVDDCIVANSASGVLTGLDARTGVARYTHVFSSNKGGDQPRRFEPVLRSGALFVPQHQVHVVRPKDGELLGTLPSDLIPDLIRVDERCDVYIAEDSGHVAAFGAAPRLSLVR
jgi:outer membrane protein assembly factor BamB